MNDKLTLSYKAHLAVRNGAKPKVYSKLADTKNELCDTHHFVRIRECGDGYYVKVPNESFEDKTYNDYVAKFYVDKRSKEDGIEITTYASNQMKARIELDREQRLFDIRHDFAGTHRDSDEETYLVPENMVVRSDTKPPDEDGYKWLCATDPYTFETTWVKKRVS